jgi:hypothetical protein
MALGCAFIFVVILMLWRRHARKRRVKATAMFATAKRLDRPAGWRLRLMRFGEKLFGHKRSNLTPPADEQYKMEKLRDVEEARYNKDMDKFLDAYDYSRAGSSRGPSPLPSLHDYGHDKYTQHRFSDISLSNGSLYSHITGQPRTAPEPRQPVRNVRDLLPSRFSDTTASHMSPEPSPPPVPSHASSSRPPTPAQEYARLVTLNQPGEQRGAYGVERTDTGNSTNPFRR